jgi:hypothetical protein
MTTGRRRRLFRKLGPGLVVMQHYGFTVDNVCEQPTA